MFRFGTMMGGIENRQLIGLSSGTLTVLISRSALGILKGAW
jgi:hypothetical protein